jgi:hypothetical protein
MTVYNETGVKVHTNNQTRAISDTILVLMALRRIDAQHVDFICTHFIVWLTIAQSRLIFR